ncbi:pentatricopeptide repeat-containing protein [Planoprotostelium fungivorum]|uniref:Pentatricopeptide repeat-containing protein n=1 Tax=Planoprotostelium fungivorum TaxID=1890364 RepID=A0A2P6NYR6_9EUKA|nr:pentatricopeptide repeat-containing protein [Planoprotostelium fungivorum]
MHLGGLRHSLSKTWCFGLIFSGRNHEVLYFPSVYIECSVVAVFDRTRVYKIISPPPATVRVNQYLLILGNVFVTQVTYHWNQRILLNKVDYLLDPRTLKKIAYIGTYHILGRVPVPMYAIFLAYVRVNQYLLILGNVLVTQVTYHWNQRILLNKVDYLFDPLKRKYITLPDACMSEVQIGSSSCRKRRHIAGNPSRHPSLALVKRPTLGKRCTSTEAIRFDPTAFFSVESQTTVDESKFRFNERKEWEDPPEGTTDLNPWPSRMKQMRSHILGLNLFKFPKPPPSADQYYHNLTPEEVQRRIEYVKIRDQWWEKIKRVIPKDIKPQDFLVPMAAFERENDLEMFVKLWKKLPQQSKVPLESKHFHYLMRHYASKWDIGRLEGMWERMMARLITPDEIVMDILVTFFSRCENPRKTLHYWTQMRKWNLSPLPTTSTAMLAVLRKTGNLDGVEKLWEELVQQGEHQHLSIYNEAIRAKGAQGNFADAERLWTEVLSGKNAPQLAHYNGFLEAAVHCERGEFVQPLWDEMKSKGFELNAKTYTLLSKYFSSKKDEGKVEEMWRDIQAFEEEKAPRNPDRVIERNVRCILTDHPIKLSYPFFEAIIRMYEGLGNQERADYFNAEMEYRGHYVPAYTWATRARHELTDWKRLERYGYRLKNIRY